MSWTIAEVARIRVEPVLTEQELDVLRMVLLVGNSNEHWIAIGMLRALYSESVVAQAEIDGWDGRSEYAGLATEARFRTIGRGREAGDEEVWRLEEEIKRKFPIHAALARINSED